MAEPQHSEWGASKFQQIMLCPGSKVLQQGLPDTSSKYASEGTAAHSLLEMCLRTDRDAVAFKGQILQADGLEFEVDDDMIDHIQWTIDTVREYQGEGVLLAEQRVHYHGYLSVEEGTGFGTADVVILRGDEVIVMDLKYGRGEEVEAKDNPQLRLYALGTLAAHQGLSGDFKRVRMVILQPRIVRRPLEDDMTVEELEAWGYGPARSAVCTARNAAEAGENALVAVYLNPGRDQCRWCKAKATCPALREEVALTVAGAIDVPMSADEFENLDLVAVSDTTTVEYLAASLAKVDLIEDWCTAVRAEVERRLLAGEPIPGYKLVQGKRGNRAWSDAKAAEEALKAMRLKVEEMYELKLISPTAAEKLAPKFDKTGKPVPPKEGAPVPPIGPRQWPKLKALITQSEGKPHVAPLSDERPALEVKPVAEEFEDLDDLT